MKGCYYRIGAFFRLKDQFRYHRGSRLNQMTFQASPANLHHRTLNIGRRGTRGEILGDHCVRTSYTLDIERL